MDARDRHGAVAAWIEDFVGRSYGPGGGRKLVDAGDLRVLDGAAALREIEATEPDAQPYRRLAESVEGTVGDQASTAVLLTAAMVKGLVDTWHPSHLDALRLARRQALATLHSLAEPMAIERVFGPEGKLIQEGLADLAVGGRVALDDIAITPSDVEGLTWSEGVRLEHDPPMDGDLRVVVLQGSLQPRNRGPSMTLVGLSDDSHPWTREQADTLHEMRVDLLLTTGAIDEELQGRLHDRGISTWADVPKDAARRIARSAGGQVVPMPDAGAVGSLRVERRHKETWGIGGRSATLLLPRSQATQERAQLHAIEALLRAVGAFQEDPRGVPGEWPEQLADGMRRIADHGPGRTPIGLRVIAAAFDALLVHLRRNLGQDPLQRRPVDAWHGHAAVREAVSAAFETAEAILRIDARHDRAVSTTTALRGGDGPVGSPRGMPGDVPPLM